MTGIFDWADTPSVAVVVVVLLVVGGIVGVDVVVAVMVSTS